MKALILPAGGASALLRDVPDEWNDDLAGAQELVGGFVEFVRLTPTCMALVNEEGIPKGLPLNHLAALLLSGPYYGTVVLLRDEGPASADFKDVPEDAILLASAAGIAIVDETA